MTVNGPDIIRKSAGAIRVHHAKTNRGPGNGCENRSLRIPHDVRERAPLRCGVSCGRKNAAHALTVKTVPIVVVAYQAVRYWLAAEIHRVKNTIASRVSQVNVLLHDGSELTEEKLTCNCAFDIDCGLAIVTRRLGLV